MNPTKQPRAGLGGVISRRGTLALAFLLILLTASAAAAQDGAARLFVKQCAGCHGADGSGSGSTPALRGLTAEEARAALLGYRERTREGNRKFIMERVAKNLGDEEIAGLADHVAGL